MVSITFILAAPSFSLPPVTASHFHSSYGIPLNKIVVGKYNLAGVDASNGFVSAPTLGSWFVTAQTQLGWSAGVACWSFQASTSTVWMAAAWPASAAAPTTQPVTPTTVMPITVAPPTPLAPTSVAPTTMIPTLPRVDSCTLADPVFVCTTRCALYQCDPNQVCAMCSAISKLDVCASLPSQFV